MKRVINLDKEILGGTPVFMGTRVPIKNLFDYLEEGQSIEEFQDDFPTVKRDQIEKILELSHKLLINLTETFYEDIVG